MLLPGGHMLALALLMMDSLPGMGGRAAHSRRAVCHPRCATNRMPTTPRKAATSTRIHRRCAEERDGDQDGGTEGNQRGCSHGDFPLLAGGSDRCGPARPVSLIQ